MRPPTPETDSQPSRTRAAVRRARLLAALVLAGLATGALGTSLLGAGAQEAPLPPCETLEATTPPPEPGVDCIEEPAGDTQEPAPPAPAQEAPRGEEPRSPSEPAAATPPAAAPQAAPAEPPAPAPVATIAPAAPPPSNPGDGSLPASADDPKTKSVPEVEDKPKKRPERRKTAPQPREERDRPVRAPLRNREGVPTLDNPTTSLALPGPAPVGVPNFFIDKFRIPPFLLPIYQAAGTEYGISWQILAAINEIETDYGRNLNVSSAGALGWMQFMPASWRAFGVDANRDGKKDPFNPVDAIFAAARYLKEHGGEQDLRRAIFAYNHADWYVDSVLMRAKAIGGMPEDLVGSLTGLTQGKFPVHARARYADDISERDATRRVAQGSNAANPVESDGLRRGINVYAKAGSPVIAVQDGTIVRVGRTERLGRYVKLRDAFGNTYTYAHLKKTATHVPVPRDRTQSKASIAAELELPGSEHKDARRAKATSLLAPRRVARDGREVAVREAPALTEKERLFAHPARDGALPRGGRDQILDSEEEIPGYATFKTYFSEVYGLERDEVVLKRLVPGRKVIAGTILGRIGRTDEKVSPHVLFEIRPAGRGAPRIDPKPILDGWKLLESTAIYRAQGRHALLGRDAKSATIGEILLMSKEALQRRVVSNPRIDVYSCGERDIRAGLIDRRVLASLEFLAASGMRPTVTSLRCGRSTLYTASGNLSAHPSGNAVDIAMINGVPILGNQGKGSITDLAVRRLLTLQGTMKPNQIITLMQYEGTDNTLAMGDHHDHIHVGFRPQLGSAATAGGKHQRALLKPSQWIKLIGRLSEIDNPAVSTKPSKYSIPVAKPERASGAHAGE